MTGSVVRRRDHPGPGRVIGDRTEAPRRSRPRLGEQRVVLLIVARVPGLGLVW